MKYLATIHVIIEADNIGDAKDISNEIVKHLSEPNEYDLPENEPGYKYYNPEINTIKKYNDL